MKELYPNNNFNFIQDSAPFHRAKTVQNFSWEELKSRFFANMEWLPSSPECNTLDYYFWNEVKEKVYKLFLLPRSKTINSGHHAKPFESEKELKNRIFSVWDQCAINVEPLSKAIKQFLPFLKPL